MHRIDAVDELLKVVGKLLARAWSIARSISSTTAAARLRAFRSRARARRCARWRCDDGSSPSRPAGGRCARWRPSPCPRRPSEPLPQHRAHDERRKLLLGLLELELKVVVGGFLTGADGGFHHLVLGHRRLLVGILYLVLGSLGGRASLASVSSTASTGIFTSFSSESTGAALAAAASVRALRADMITCPRRLQPRSRRRPHRRRSGRRRHRRSAAERRRRQPEPARRPRTAGTRQRP